MKYHGSCHCRAISFSFEGDFIEKGLRCNCSICRRKGIMISPYTIKKEDLIIKEESLTFYQAGEKRAKQYFCKQCGIQTFNESATKPGNYRVNLGCLDKIDTFSLEYDIFDGVSL